MKMIEEFKTNIRIIDEQHSNLFNIIEKLKTVENDSEELKILIIELFEYTKYHFNTEEKFFENYNNELYEKQKKYHAGFKKKLESYIDEINQDVDIDEFKYNITVFLEKWWKNHILKEDIKIKDYIKK